MTEALQEAAPQATDYATYQTTGERPDRTVIESRGGVPVHMMSEIGEGVFVAWDQCSACHQRIKSCACPSGPMEPPYIAGWRESYQHPATPSRRYDSQDLDEDEPEDAREEHPGDDIAQLVDQGLSNALEALKARVDDDSDVGF